MRKLFLGLFVSSLLLASLSCRETEMNTDGNVEEGDIKTEKPESE